MEDDCVDSKLLSNFDFKEKIGQGAYGIVWRAIDKSTNKPLAVKKCFDSFRNNEDSQRTYREISYLKALKGHENIVQLLDHVVTEKDLYLLFDYVETDLHVVISHKILLPIHIQFIIYQLLKALKYIHSAGLLHRDIKPSNVLLDPSCNMKLCDFGLCRSIKEGWFLTDYVATRYYRPPEVLLGSKGYSQGIDMFAVGCVLGEMFLSRPIFPGNSTMNQLEKIVEVIGFPTASERIEMQSPFTETMLNAIVPSQQLQLSRLCPNAPDEAVDLMEHCMKFSPWKRCSAELGLTHVYVSDFHNPSYENNFDGEIKIHVDDDTQVSADDYRHLIMHDSTS